MIETLVCVRSFSSDFNFFSHDCELNSVILPFCQTLVRIPFELKHPVVIQFLGF